jgi:phosphate transport system substrate-binding protein
MTMNRIACSLIALAAIASPALADEIRIVGSSTVYPFTTAVAENFSKKTGLPTPIVESTGTGGGIKLFCDSAEPQSPSAVNASRPIKETEVESCKKNGVEGITELEIGIDAIVLAEAKNGSDFSLTTKQIYQALAKNVIIDGKLVPNPYVNWSDIDASLPSHKIEVLGPPPTSGTRDSFTELVIEHECKGLIKEFGLTMSPDEEKSACKSIREDGAYIEAGENDNLIVQKLVNNPKAIGIFGFSFLDANGSEIKGVTINGVKPEYDAVAAGEYPISRKLYVYFKDAHLESKANLAAFLEEYKSEQAIGEEGYLVEKGLIPLPKE